MADTKNNPVKRARFTYRTSTPEFSKSPSRRGSDFWCCTPIIIEADTRKEFERLGESWASSMKEAMDNARKSAEAWLQQHQEYI